ncbi:MAG: [FeFe] hydrogenase H-cluster radical SAM maturase HydE [Desulfobacteraceae bacterium]|nr:[FeFe] hydrogenase H-cluster radical SAM maturase HydE [Desulfobacteraceae bacterium]
MKKDREEDRGFILEWLREENTERLRDLWRAADRTRRECVGEAVHLRALVEISNTCVRQCAYCGLRAGNAGLERYRMNREEILRCVRDSEALGIGTVVLQGAEDFGLSREWIADIVRQIKQETSMAVTLSLGERTIHELETWRDAGADRYFLRFETSDPDLYKRIHPPRRTRPISRIRLLQRLKNLGYETGSGVMIGIPGQSYTSLANDILLFRQLDLDMIGVGPWLPNPATPMGALRDMFPDCPDQVPNTEDMAYKVIALTRIHCPEANIPSTTALATLNAENGYERGLNRGANVIMPNCTPAGYRRKYEIYPKKVLLSHPKSNVEGICLRIASLGRQIGRGQGQRIRHEKCEKRYATLPMSTRGAA